jgi:hypothetical protein
MNGKHELMKRKLIYKNEIPFEWFNIEWICIMQLNWTEWINGNEMNWI